MKNDSVSEDSVTPFRKKSGFRVAHLWSTGVVLLLFGVVAAIFQSSFQGLFVVLHVLLGVFCILISFFSFRKEKKSYNRSRLYQSLRFSFATSGYLLFIVLLLAGIILLSIRFDYRWDLSEQSVNSLSSYSKQIVENINTPVKIFRFVDDVQLEKLLHLYSYHQPHIRSEYINPQLKPHFLDRYGVRPGEQLLIEYGEGKQKRIGRLYKIDESSISETLWKLKRGTAQKVYLVQGHGEPDPESRAAVGIASFREALEASFLSLETILIGKLWKIPEDTAAVVLVAPKGELMEREQELLVHYVKNGGALVIFADPVGSTNPYAFLKTFGITLEQDVVIDQVQRLFGAPTLGAQPIIQDFEKHPITRELGKNHPVIFSVASSLSLSAKEDPTVSIQPLFQSSITAWGETDLELALRPEDPQAFLGKEDHKGPLTLAAVYQRVLKTNTDEKTDAVQERSLARVVVFGDSSWIRNDTLDLYGHRTLLLNTINWAVHEEGEIFLQGKGLRSTLQPVSNQAARFLLIPMLLLPEFFILLGIWIRIRRSMR